MKHTAQTLNEILKQTSRHKYWFGFNRFSFNECFAWANNVADVSDPQWCFRNQVVDEGSRTKFHSEYHSQIFIKRARVNKVGFEVADLYGPPQSPNLMGGRMLVMRPDYTLSDGLSYQLTNGFFDIDNFPPPMLTAALVDCPEFVENANGIYLRQGFYILSYIPKSFISMVQKAIDTNPEECILWLEDEEHFTAKIFKKYGLWTL